MQVKGRPRTLAQVWDSFVSQRCVVTLADTHHQRGVRISVFLQVIQESLLELLCLIRSWRLQSKSSDKQVSQGEKREKKKQEAICMSFFGGNISLNFFPSISRTFKCWLIIPVVGYDQLISGPFCSWLRPFAIGRPQSPGSPERLLSEPSQSACYWTDAPIGNGRKENVRECKASGSWQKTDYSKE